MNQAIDFETIITSRGVDARHGRIRLPRGVHKDLLNPPNLITFVWDNNRQAQKVKIISCGGKSFHINIPFSLMIDGGFRTKMKVNCHLDMDKKMISITKL